MLIQLLLVFSVSFILTWGIRGVCLKYALLDNPNVRSSHAVPTARLGGIGFISAYVICVIFFLHLSPVFFKTLALALGVAGFSLVDDLRGLKARTRFLAHLGFSVCILIIGVKLIQVSVPFYVMKFGSVFIEVGLSLLFLTAMTNIYNFMDGIDGYAAGQGIVGAAALACFSGMVGNSGLMQALFFLTAALSGFLIWNYPKAKIFMGDVGSAFLGFFFGAIMLYLTLIRPELLIPMIMVFGVFIMDASVTLIRRAINKEKIWEAHRSHFYQRLTLLGWSHRKVIWVEYGHMAICCILAFGYIYLQDRSQIGLIGVFFLTFIGKFSFITLLERSRAKVR